VGCWAKNKQTKKQTNKQTNLNTLNKAYFYVTHVIPCSIQMITYRAFICIFLLNRLPTVESVNTSAWQEISHYLPVMQFEIVNKYIHKLLRETVVSCVQFWIVGKL